MKLYDKLHPEVKKQIQTELDKYPTLTQGLIDELQSKKFHTDLTLGSAHTLFIIVYPLTIFDLTKYFELFNYGKEKQNTAI